jgi:hypothetical protein
MFPTLIYRAHYSHYLCLFSKAKCVDFHHLVAAVRAVPPGLTVQRTTFNPSNSHGICGYKLALAQVSLRVPPISPVSTIPPMLLIHYKCHIISTILVSLNTTNTSVCAHPHQHVHTYKQCHELEMTISVTGHSQTFLIYIK